MAKVRIVEILDARGHVRARAHVASFPASIGRAFDNDVIVDDPYVSPHHCRLTEDDTGTLWVEDTGSRNGTRRSVRGEPEHRFAVASGGEVVLGRATLRIFNAGHAVPEALPWHRTGISPLEVFSAPRVAASAAGVAALVFGARGYFGGVTRDVAENIITMPLATLLMTAIWAGVWALIGRMTHAGARFRAHFGWACAGAVALLAATTLLGWVEFAVPASRAVAVLSGTLLTALFAVYLAGHVSLASSLTPPQAVRRTVSGFVVGAAVLALVNVSSGDQFLATPDFSTTIAPVPPALLQTAAVDDFAAEVLKLQKEVDKLAGKRERASLLPRTIRGL